MKLLIESTSLGFERLEFLIRTGQLERVVDLAVQGIVPVDTESAHLDSDSAAPAAAAESVGESAAAAGEADSW